MRFPGITVTWRSGKRWDAACSDLIPICLALSNVCFYIDYESSDAQSQRVYVDNVINVFSAI